MYNMYTMYNMTTVIINLFVTGFSTLLLVSKQTIIKGTQLRFFDMRGMKINFGD
jgi:hypothetical protein